MTEDLSPAKTASNPLHEHLSLIDLLVVREAYERSSIHLYERLMEKCRNSKDPVIRAIDLTRLDSFREMMTEHLHLLTQALDVLGNKVQDNHGDQAGASMANGPTLLLARAAQQQISDPGIPVLPSLQALLALEQFSEVAWGLLLALMKDAELQRFVVHFERACARHSEQRLTLQQTYEDVALGLVRRNQLTTKSTHPLKSRMTGRALLGML